MSEYHSRIQEIRERYSQKRGFIERLDGAEYPVVETSSSAESFFATESNHLD